MIENFIEGALESEVKENINNIVIKMMMELDDMSHKQAKVTYHQESDFYINKYKVQIKEFLEKENCKNEKDSLLEALDMTTKEGFEMFFMGTTKKEESEITEKDILGLIDTITSNDCFNVEDRKLTEKEENLITGIESTPCKKETIMEKLLSTFHEDDTIKDINILKEEINEEDKDSITSVEINNIVKGITNFLDISEEQMIKALSKDKL